MRCSSSNPHSGTEGRLKTQRKGVGGAEIIVTGRSAHAGIDPEKGVNAVHELALQIERLMQMNDPRRGITVQPTIVNGGTVTNVVPEHARAPWTFAIRAWPMQHNSIKKLRAMRPILKGAHIEVRRRAIVRRSNAPLACVNYSVVRNR